jgi:hypothetical protein
VKRMKSIKIRKAGIVRLTATAASLYGPRCCD